MSGAQRPASWIALPDTSSGWPMRRTSSLGGPTSTCPMSHLTCVIPGLKTDMTRVAENGDPYGSVMGKAYALVVVAHVLAGCAPWLFSTREPHHPWVRVLALVELKKTREGPGGGMAGLPRHDSLVLPRPPCTPSARQEDGEGSSAPGWRLA